MAATTCSHGFPQPSCLICRTLGTGAQTAAHVLPAPRRRLPMGTKVLGTAVLVIAVMVGLGLAIVVAKAVFATAFRLLELGAVALVAAYVGWWLGVRHGRRATRSPR